MCRYKVTVRPTAPFGITVSTHLQEDTSFVCGVESASGAETISQPYSAQLHGATALLVVLASSVSLAQARTIENRHLTWSDFKGSPDRQNPDDAYAYWFVRYRYDDPAQGSVRPVVSVWNEFGEQSWVKWDTPRENEKDQLLNHEQGHYSLGVLCALEFKKAVAESSFTADYPAELNRIFSSVLKKYQDMEKLYDLETRGMYDRANQPAWDARLGRMIDELWRYR